MKSVFLLWHTHELSDGQDESKLVGVYTTRRAAKAAQTRAIRLPGFSQHRGGFEITAYELDRDHWVEGFVKIRS
jgi:hypothetical protein